MAAARLMASQSSSSVSGLWISPLAPERSAAARIKRLEAMEEWTRSLSGVLTVGVGLEQALVATLRRWL